MPKCELAVYNKENCRFFALGRNAIYAACQILCLEPGDEVLTPAFDCDGTLQPFKALGLKLEFFRSEPYTFSVDIKDISERINKKTKLVHIINHFGLPQPWPELIKLRQEYGIPILEDNAYSLFSRYQGRLFGTFGDLSVFSLRKNLPLIDGGLLRINNPDYVFKDPYRRPGLFHPVEARGVLNLIKQALGYKYLPEAVKKCLRKLNPATFSPVPLYSEDGGVPQWPLRDEIGRDFSCNYLRPMSYLAKVQLGILKQEDFAQIMEKKRLYYSFMARKLSELKGLRVLWPELPQGIVPFCFSFLVSSGRDYFLSCLQQRYDVMAWPTLPGLVIDKLKNYPEVELLGRGLVQVNLTADKVRNKNFTAYLENLVEDIRKLSSQV